MKCVWCGKTSKPTFHTQVRWQGLNSKWYRCPNCGSLLIWPRPSAKLIRGFYEDNYRNKIQPHSVNHRLRYSQQYRPTVFAGYAQSLTDVGIHKNRVESVLDFGCADGIFLEFAQKYFKPHTLLYGTDLSEDMLKVARQRGWRVISLVDLASLKIKFDLITIWDVIEHTTDPGRVMATLKKMLNPKGRIVIQTPRFGILAELLGEHWEHLLPIQHLNLASKEGMQRFVQRMGLVVDGYGSFGANAPSAIIPEPHKSTFDRLAKKLDFGSEQVFSLRIRT